MGGRGVGVIEGYFGSNAEIILIGKYCNNDDDSNGKNNAYNVKWIREHVGDANWGRVVKQGKFQMMSYVSSFNNM